MQQPQVTTYVDISEVRTVTGAAACNQLLADGWVLLGVYPLTTVAEMASGGPDGEQRKQDIQRYVRRFVGYGDKGAPLLSKLGVSVHSENSNYDDSEADRGKDKAEPKANFGLSNPLGMIFSSQ